MSATLTKTAARAVNSRIRLLRSERVTGWLAVICHGACPGALGRLARTIRSPPVRDAAPSHSAATGLQRSLNRSAS